MVLVAASCRTRIRRSKWTTCRSRPAISWNNADKSRCAMIAAETANSAWYRSSAGVAGPSKSVLVIAKPLVSRPEPAGGPPHRRVFEVACVKRIVPRYREASLTPGYRAGAGARRSETPHAICLALLRCPVTSP